MTTFTALKTEIGKKIQRTDTTYLAKIADWINRRYETLWNMYPWTAIVVIDEAITLTAASSSLYLPKDIGQIICLTQRETDAIILPTSPYVFQRRYLDTITEQSDPIAYVYAGEVFAKAQPASASVITAVSSSASDTTQKVRIWGKVSSEETSDQIALNGTTGVSTTNQYTAISRISKDAVTVGRITISSGATTLAVISPRETAPLYIKINLYYVPDSAISVYCTYKKRFRKLDYDEDILEIPPVEPSLIRLVYSDCLREQRQFSKAMAEETAAWDDLNKLILGTEIQKDMVIQMFPHSENQEQDNIWRSGNV